jgi:hypothetical protein
MRESTSWRARRFIALIAVAAVHVALVALLLNASAMYRVADPAYRPIELVYIPAPPPPPVRADTGRPPRLRADIALVPTLPMMTSAPPASASSGTGSHGVGVDWLAEAHRAVKAYEIRREQPAESSLSGKSPANDWWPQQGPHAGDSYKNDAGDWIVWIDSDCYKIASWHSADPAANAGPPRIVCPRKPGAPPNSP